MGYQRATHVAWRQLDGETVVVNLRAKRIVALNAAGGTIWDAMSQTRSAHELAGALVSNQSDSSPSADLVAGVHCFLEDLLRLDLASASDSAATESRGQSHERTDYRMPELPKVTWEEAVSNFGASCAENPISNPNCIASPVV